LLSKTKDWEASYCPAVTRNLYAKTNPNQLKYEFSASARHQQARLGGLLVHHCEPRLTKVSLYVDDAAWKRFREQTFAKYGTLRKLSDEVEALICSDDIEGLMTAGAKKLGVTIDRALTPAEIKRTRPKLRGAVAEQLVRDPREEHHGGRPSRQEKVLEPRHKVRELFG
jgi:hypothetical protein